MFIRVIACLLLTASAFAYEEPRAMYASTRLKRVDSPMAFHENNKVGVGTVFSGATGLFGAHLHAYFGPDFGYGLGFGGADNLRAFTFYFRHLLADTFVAPYWTLGYARWWNKGDEPITKTSPSYLYNKFLSAKEKSTGTFTEHLLYPGLGLQWYNLRGRFSGLSIYSEGLLMVDIDDRRVNLALGVGIFRYL